MRGGEGRGKGKGRGGEGRGGDEVLIFTYLQYIHRKAS